MRYTVTRTTTETIKVEARNPADALDKSESYENQYLWTEHRLQYGVEEA